MSDPLAAILDALARPVPASSDYDLAGAKPPERALRDAGVLVLIDQSGPVPMVILTKRASHLKHHPGQIAFAGGKVDPTDQGPIAAALREAEEEIGLPRDKVEVLGTLPPHETVTGFNVTPVLARVRVEIDYRPEVGEVAEVFAVPLSFLLDLARYQIQGRVWLGQVRAYYAVPYGPYYIWGATARILRNLAQQVAG